MTRDEIITLAKLAPHLRLGDPLDRYRDTYAPYYPFLYCLMALGRCERVVELGTLHGASALYLAEGNPASTVWTVDTNPNQWRVETVLGQNIRRIVATTVDALKQAPESIDLLFVDADHSYDAVNLDVTLWGPRVRSGGLIVLDDTQYYDEGRHWRELVARYGDHAIALDWLHTTYGFGVVIQD